MRKLKDKVNIHLKPPIVYYGGKQLLLPKIIPLVPKHKKYVEPFCGGGALYWAKEPAEIEIINDIDGFVANFYSVVKNNFEALRLLLNSKAYSRLTHEHAGIIRKHPELFNKVKRAWAFYYLANTSLYAIFGNTQNIPSKDAKPIKTYNSKNERFTQIYEERLKNTYIESRDALYVISKHNSPDTFLFIDPPYYNSDCGHYGGYSYEMYKELLELLSLTESKFLLTCYPSDLIDDYASKNGWIVERHEMLLNAGNKGKKKIELFVKNYTLD